MPVNEDNLPPIKRVKTDPENINLSYDQFVAKRRKQKELEARLEIEKHRIEKELEAEEVPAEADPNEVETVETIKSKKGNKKKDVAE